MAKNPKYFYRACFRPDSLDVFKGFDRGLNSDGRGLGYAQVWHRGESEHRPYSVFNELICGEIGRFLRLPVPPFAITFYKVNRRRQFLFSSLDFNFNRAKLPPIIPGLCEQKLPWLCAGVLAFDILIANEDRHDENLLVDSVARPKEMHIYDHEQALLGGFSEMGVERLKKLRDRMAITGSTVTGGNRHVFLDCLRSAHDLYEWGQRIRDIPDWFISSVCREATNYGLAKKIAKEAEDFLIYRRPRIVSMIEDNCDQFPRIGNWDKQQRLLLT